MFSKPATKNSSLDGDFRPRARRRRLVVQALDGETLVYDQENHKAHRLSPFAGRLWEACDGRRTIGDMKKAWDWSTASIAQGLHELNSAGLLEEPPPEQPTRRGMLGRLGRSVAVPAVVSILVPQAASAQSCFQNTHPCTSSSQCCSGCCKREGNSQAFTCRKKETNEGNPCI